MSEDFLEVSVEKYQNKEFPEYRRPTIIGEYSVTKDKELSDGRKLLRYLNEKMTRRQCQLDLSQGYSTFLSKDEFEMEKLDVLLKWVVMKSQQDEMTKEVSNERSRKTGCFCVSILFALEGCTHSENNAVRK